MTDTDLAILINEATQAIIQTRQVEAALDVVLPKACQLIRGQCATLYLASSKEQLRKGKIFTTTHLSIDDTLFFELAQQVALSQTITSTGQTSEPDWPTPALASALFVPLISREKLFGVLFVGSQHVEAFSKEEIKRATLFSNQLAIAIENARLYQDLSLAYIDLAQSREKILHGRNTLKAIFDGITDGLYILNKDLTISALNQIEAERQNCLPRALVGQSFLTLSWAKHAPTLLDKIKESLETGRETTWISAEDESEPYLKDREFRIYPIRDRLAQIEQVMVFAQDVAERRRWQASLFRSANLAAVGQLAGSVAHQINNPLTVTMTNSQLIMLDTDPHSETSDLAAGILKAGERMQNIVTNLLEFSNQEEYFFIQTNLVDTIEGALALVIRSLKKATIEVVKDYQVQPSLSASVSHLKLVWINLLLNARDAVLEHNPEPQIKISTRAVSEREVKVSITDNGAGINPSHFEHLFRPFFTTKPVGKALGLGLYSAHAIVERHRGKIRPSSQPGIATTFEVILPLDNPRDL